MTVPYVLLLVLLPLLGVLAEDTPCDCYQTSTNDYFHSYLFHDFRNLTAPAEAPPIDSKLPAHLDYSTGAASTNVGSLQSGFIASSTFNDSWSVSQWGKPSTSDFPTPMWNSLSNVYLTSNATEGNATSKLVLRTRRFPHHQLAAEMEHQQKNLFHASVRIRARVSGVKGGVAGMFYYRNDANESDIEILTRDPPDTIRYTNQPSVDDDGNEINDASSVVDMSSGTAVDVSSVEKRGLFARTDTNVKYTDWHTYRIDWTEKKSAWFVDGKHMLDKTYSVPTRSSYLVVNMWSDGGEWSGNMSVGAEARLEVEWVEIVYNTTGPVTDSDDGYTKRSLEGRSSNRCKHVCVVNDTTEKGIVDGGYTRAKGQAGGRLLPSWLLWVVTAGAVLGGLL